MARSQERAREALASAVQRLNEATAQVGFQRALLIYLQSSKEVNMQERICFVVLEDPHRETCLGSLTKTAEEKKGCEERAQKSISSS